MRCITFSVVALLALGLAGCGDGADAKNNKNNKDGGKNTKIEGGMPIDTDASKIAFVGTKDEGKHDGGFKDFSGTIKFDPEKLDQSAIAVEIDTGSMWSDNEKLTNHLKSADFFEVNKHGKAMFESTGIAKTDVGYDITGKLTIKGKTNEITVPATISKGEGEVTVKASFEIDRFDYGIEYGKGKVHDTVTINAELVANK